MKNRNVDAASACGHIPNIFSLRLRERFPEAFWTDPPMLPGIVLPQFVRCGKQGCHCAGGDLHGPYFYHYHRGEARAVKRYLRKEEVPAVAALCREHRDLQKTLLTNRREWAEAYRQIKRNLRETDRMMSEYLRGNP